MMPGIGEHPQGQPGLDVDAILARADAASDGPWTEPEYDEEERAWFILNGQVGTEQHAVACVASVWSARFAQANAEFIAHARTDVPVLAAELKRLRAVVQRVVSITQDTDGDALNNDETVPVGEVLRMLYEFHEDVVTRAFPGRSSNEPGA